MQENGSGVRLSSRVDAIGDDAYRVTHHLEKAARHAEPASSARLSHLQHTRAEQREKRRMTRQDADLSVERGHHDRVGGPIEYRSLGGNDRDVHHSGAGQTLRLLQGFVDPRDHVERLLGKMVELSRDDALE